MDRIVVDLGNSRLKFGRVAPDRTVSEVRAHNLDEAQAIEQTLESWIRRVGHVHLTIASVNPPALEARILRPISGCERVTLRILRNAGQARIAHQLMHPEQTGVDRALAVQRALDRQDGRGPGRVISCGTAITVEKIREDGTWLGGAITVGLGLAARALNQGTAQLPLIAVSREPVPAWGGATAPAMAAGLLWGTVGGVREILERQSDKNEPAPWRIWTGGEAHTIAPWIDGPAALIVDDLVLEALAQLDPDAGGVS